MRSRQKTRSDRKAVRWIEAARSLRPTWLMSDQAYKAKETDAPKTAKLSGEKRCKASTKNFTIGASQNRICSEKGKLLGQADKAIPCPSLLLRLILSTLLTSHIPQIRKQPNRLFSKIPRCRTDAIHKTNLLSYYEMAKITLPGSPTPSVGFNSSAAIEPSTDGRSQTWNQFVPLSLKMDSPRQIYSLPLSSRQWEMRRKTTLLL